METNYNKLLYEKMQAENETFKDWLLSQEPAEILNHAYEYTIYQDNKRYFPCEDKIQSD